MNFKTILPSLLLLTAALASCCKIEVCTLPDENGDHQYQLQGKAFVKDEAHTGEAYVRIGFYEELENYKISITKMWVETSGKNENFLQLGTNIISSGIISEDYSDPTFDLDCGEYHNIAIDQRLPEIRIHFNATVICNGSDCRIPVEDAVAVIKTAESNLQNNHAYSYVIRVNAGLLGLKDISFNPSVSDYVTVNSTEKV